MKKTKIFHGNQYIESFDCNGKRYSKFQLFVVKAKRALKRTTIALAALFTIIWSSVAYRALYPVTVFADKEVQVVVESTSTPPVLQRIMSCESTGNAHTKATQKAKNGQITYNVNTDGTIDIGIGQINSVNFAQATKLGYDLTKESDNIAFAKWLYANRGTEPWKSSKACWNKYH